MGKRNRNSNKRDNLEVKGQLNSTNYKQNPNWYFKDAVQADVLSRIQMNAFGAITKIGNDILPTVCALYANPCPGVTKYEVGVDPQFNAKGINRAAQKLWYILTCKSGRAAGYTKADVALLLLGMGGMIETYEFIRRVFGIAYTYNQRNRALPGMLFQAMCVDMQDYQKNAAVYLKRMNSLMAIMNQLPMPGNISWFAKCQDIYQNIYMDYPAEMAQLFVISPSTTWVIEENDGFIGGSYLRTVDMCIKHADSTSSSPITIGKSSNSTIQNSDGKVYGVSKRSTKVKRLRNLSEYIDVFEEQVNNLLFSSTFSQIYSDLLRAFDNGTLSRWSFDYIDEKYNIAPVFDDNRLWMFHNATIANGLQTISRSNWQSKWSTDPEVETSYGYVFQYGTPCNDVYQWAKTDVVLYNPGLTTYIGSAAAGKYTLETDDVVVDFPSDAPTVEQRVDYTRYIFTPSDNEFASPTNYTGSTAVMYNVSFNMLLPDHWFEFCELLFGAEDAPMMIADDPYSDVSRRSEISGSSSHQFNGVTAMSKFHHGPMIDNFNYGSGIGKRGSVFGEMNAWALLRRSWFSDINDMIYVDLFDIR